MPSFVESFWSIDYTTGTISYQANSIYRILSFATLKTNTCLYRFLIFFFSILQV
jgi:hypothetical protein